MFIGCGANTFQAVAVASFSGLGVYLLSADWLCNGDVMDKQAYIGDLPASRPNNASWIIKTASIRMSAAVSSSMGKAKQDLLSKNVLSTGTGYREIQLYKCLSIAPEVDDVLAWWNSQKDTYPRLSLFARTILAIPATSAPPEYWPFQLQVLHQNELFPLWDWRWMRSEVHSLRQLSIKSSSFTKTPNSLMTALNNFQTSSDINI